ncbi:hypothetical protein TWF718_008562 [Orbilia javanica]|uniref:Uncharacterized protein n=1 Tax=Orbilia javanica TaxID=47235 RepID=A0AAN8MUJ7_9PEZI
MATQLVPYNTTMQLGSGFNSFTQTLCVNNAVVRDTELIASKQNSTEVEQIAQSIVYKTSIIDKTTDVTDEMQINAAFNIKYDQLKVNSSGNFVNTNKIKESDVSIMVSVKVVNQVIYNHSLTKFQPITGLKDLTPQRLAEIYGDSAEIAFTRTKDPAVEADKDKKDLQFGVGGTFDKLKKNFITENEVSVSVT